MIGLIKQIAAMPGKNQQFGIAIGETDARLIVATTTGQEQLIHDALIPLDAVYNANFSLCEIVLNTLIDKLTKAAAARIENVQTPVNATAHSVG